MDALLPDSKTIKLYTSAFMICTLSDKNVTDKFLSLFPLVADRLGNGSPGEVFEFDFCAYIEHSHNLLKAEERLMGKGKCKEIQIELGTDIMTDEKGSLACRDAAKLAKRQKSRDGRSADAG